jgi:hypothetical protein
MTGAPRQGQLLRASAAPRLFGAMIFVLCVLWALWPPDRLTIEPIPDPAEITETALPEPAMKGLNLAAFSTPLWVAAPTPPPEPAPAAPLLPLRLQLVAIVQGATGLRAILFDPDTDRLYALAQGQAVGSGTIEEVTEHGVEIHDAVGTRTLALHKDEAR